MNEDGQAEWDRSWTKVQGRGTATADAATELVLGAFRGDSAFELIDIVAAADDAGLTADLVQGALRICAEIARRNRTAEGLMAISAAWMHAADHGSTISRLAARLLLAYSAVDDTANFESIDQLDPSVFHGYGAQTFNDVILEAGDLCDIVVLRALALSRHMLPEVSTKTIKNIAAQLWRTT